MLRFALVLVLVPLVVTWLAPSRRTAIAASTLGAVALWLLIARFAYHSPIPLNEPEWWGGLAIVTTLAGIGIVVGAFLRQRQAQR